MKNSVFNTSFEVSLRILLTLEVSGGKMTVDMIAVSDSMTVYGRDFGISDDNLHGENCYRFGEFGVRRELVREAIKLLVLDAFITVESTKDGIVYSIDKRGADYVERLKNDYACRYREVSARTKTYLEGLSERDALRRFNKYSIVALRRRRTYG